MFEVDNELIRNLLITKLITKFHMPSKICKYSQAPNSSVEMKENNVTFSSWDDSQTTLEDFRVVMNYGVSSMQYCQNGDDVIVNLRSFPDGSALWDRNVVIRFQKKEEGYQATIMIITSEELADLDNIQTATYPQISLASLRACLNSVEDEIDPTSFAIFQEHLNTLEPIIIRDLDPQQLTLPSFE